jgi:hypothetical protein
MRYLEEHILAGCRDTKNLHTKPWKLHYLVQRALITRPIPAFLGKNTFEFFQKYDSLLYKTNNCGMLVPETLRELVKIICIIVNGWLKYITTKGNRNVLNYQIAFACIVVTLYKIVKKRKTSCGKQKTRLAAH